MLNKLKKLVTLMLYKTRALTSGGSPAFQAGAEKYAGSNPVARSKEFPGVSLHFEQASPSNYDVAVFVPYKEKE